MKFLKSELALIFALFITLTYTVFATNSQNDVSDKVLRFHVLANSNSVEDQELKIEVKNEVFEYISILTKDCDTNSQAFDVISLNLDKINSISEQVILENDYNYSSKISLNYEFYPHKNYDNFALPAGYYTGLKIEIEHGLGDNWWCVLFPPLCNQTAYDTKNLTTKELDFISSADYEFRLKFVDFFESIKYQINS